MQKQPLNDSGQSPSPQKEWTGAIRNVKGLHCRVATRLQEIAAAAPGTVMLYAGDREASCDSVLDILSLGLGRGDQITVRFEGSAGHKVLDDITAVLTMEEDP